MERFYVQMAGGAGRRVLDLACGSGRFSIALAISGAAVTGGDLSGTMFARARWMAASYGVDINFVELDMRNFELGLSFDTVLIAANSLAHLHTRADFEKCFSTIRSHLRPDGKLVFDIFVPNPAFLSLPASKRQPVCSFQHPAFGEVLVEETIKYDPVGQLSCVDWYWSTATGKDFRRTQLMLRQIFPQEVALLLDLGGLTLVERFGDFDFNPMTAASWLQVFA